MSDEIEREKRRVEREANDAWARENELPFIHISPKPDACNHDFRGWRNFADGNGGEQVCSKCGMGAMAYSLRTGL